MTLHAKFSKLLLTSCLSLCFTVIGETPSFGFGGGGKTQTQVKENRGAVLAPAGQVKAVHSNLPPAVTYAYTNKSLAHTPGTHNFQRPSGPLALAVNPTAPKTAPVLAPAPKQPGVAATQTTGSQTKSGLSPLGGPLLDMRADQEEKAQASHKPETLPLQEKEKTAPFNPTSVSRLDLRPETPQLTETKA